MRIAVITGHDVCFYMPVARHTLPGQRAYALRWGHDFVCERDWWCHTRPLSWSKLLWVGRLLPHYDWVCWLDADVLVTNPAVRLQPLIIGAGSRDLIIPRDSRLHPDCFCLGTFLVRNGPWSLQFLERVWNQEAFVEHPWWEQAAAQHLYDQDPSVREHVALVPRRAFGSPYTCPGRPEDEWQPGDFLCHFSDGRGREDLETMAHRFRPDLH
jgi:hypothetical protein